MSTRCTHGHDEHEPCLEAGRYYGAVGDRFESAGAVLSRVVHEKPRALPQHDHALAYFCMLCDGSYVETAAGRELDYKRFEVGFHPARMPHRDEVGAQGATFLCLEIHPQPMMDADVRLRRDPALLPGDVSQQMLRLYRALATGTLTGLDLESATWELCGDASGERRSVDRATPQWLRKCLEIIEAEHGEALTVASIAHRVGVHPVHASREFRRRFGQTLG